MALFKQIFASDPNNPANVATNGVISIFAPGTRTLLAIKRVTGEVEDNPLRLNSLGFGPALDVPGYTQVAWEAVTPGQVFAGTFESYEGVRVEAAAAKDAAQAAVAAVPGEVQKAVDSGDFTGPRGLPGVNAVPTAEAVATYATTPGNPVKAALDGSLDARDKHVIKLQTLNATGAIGEVNNAQFKTAMTDAKNSAKSTPYHSDPIGSKTIELPAGNYTITDINGLIGAEGMTRKVRGLRIRGAGTDLTNVYFSPTTFNIGDGLIFNQFWQNVGFQGITFITTVPGATFMNSTSVNGSAVQDLTFTDVKWNGPWKYGFNLRGTNNNCEFRFYGCSTSGFQDEGAFLFVGDTDTSDQFLNYWFYSFKHWSTGSPMIDAARGGHFHLWGVDASDWGKNLTATRYLFYLRGKSHAQGVQNFTASALRVEAKSAFAGLLYSEWADGNVDIQCDFSSQAPYFNYGDLIHIKLDSVPGPVYNFHDSHLAGGIKVEYGQDQWRHQNNIVVQDSVWAQRLTPSEVVSYIQPAVNKIDPAVKFVNVRPAANYNPTSANGASIWDATIGWAKGQLASKLEKRSISIHAINGNLADADGTYKINLPIGAMITGLTAISPAPVTQAGDDTDGGVWSVATTDAAPQPIVDVAVTTRLLLGYTVKKELSVPFLCSTRERATVTVKATGITQGKREGILILEGYW